MSNAYNDNLKRYDQLLATLPVVERKGKTMPYTSVNGNMFSFLTAEGTLALRLPTVEREEFIAEHNTKLMVQHGATLKEYVEVPDQLLKDTDKLSGYLKQSYGYVSGLKPKETKQRKTK